LAAIPLVANPLPRPLPHLRQLQPAQMFNKTQNPSLIHLAIL
jgi:hypothetical protein